MSSQYQELESVDLLTEVSGEWEVVLHNDDVNTFDYVISVLMEVCDHDQIQAEQCAFITHFKGKSRVKESSEEIAKVISLALSQKGLSSTCGPMESQYS